MDMSVKSGSATIEPLNNDVMCEDENYVSNYDDEYDIPQKSSNTTKPSTNNDSWAKYLKKEDFLILRFIKDAEDLVEYLMEKLRTFKKVSDNAIHEFAKTLTQEQIDSIMNALIDKWMKGGLNDNAIKKSDFKKLLQDINSTFNLGLSDDQINSLTDNFIKNGLLGLNTRNRDEVVTYLKNNGLWPTASSSSPNLNQTTTSSSSNDNTQEQIDVMMNALIDKWMKGGLNDNAIKKSDFKKLLQDINSTFNLGLSDDQINSLTNNFIKNGWLGLNTRNRDEVVTYLKNNGLWPTAICNVQDATGFIDSNQDGVYTKDEIQSAFNNFDTLDQNKDGVLDVNELQMSDKNFAKFDINGDRKITKDELQKFATYGMGYDKNRSDYYNYYKSKIDSIENFGSATAGMWTSNFLNKMISFISTLTTLGKSILDLGKNVDKRVT